MRAGVDDQVARGLAVVRRRKRVGPAFVAVPLIGVRDRVGAQLPTIGRCFAPLVAGGVACTLASSRGRCDRARRG